MQLTAPDPPPTPTAESASASADPIESPGHAQPSALELRLRKKHEDMRALLQWIVTTSQSGLRTQTALSKHIGQSKSKARSLTDAQKPALAYPVFIRVSLEPLLNYCMNI